MNRRELIAMLATFFRGGIAALEKEALREELVVNDLTAQRGKNANTEAAAKVRARVSQLRAAIGTATGRG